MTPDDELRQACREWLGWLRSGVTTLKGEEEALVDFVRSRERKATSRALKESSADALRALRDALGK